MKKALRYTLLAVLAVMLAAGTAFLSDRCKSGRTALTCNEVDIELLDDFEFVNTENLRAMLESEWLGVVLDSIRLSVIEDKLQSRTVILKSEAWTTDDGKLHVSITQRAPVLRCDRGDKGYYIDRTGYVFPVHKSYTAEVRTITGNIPDIEGSGHEQWVNGVVRMVTYIENSRDWKDRVERIFVDDAGDLRIKIAGADEQFIIGMPCDIENKLARIGKYFNYIAPSREDGYYKSVNLKFNKQLVCRRDI